MAGVLIAGVSAADGVAAVGMVVYEAGASTDEEGTVTPPSTAAEDGAAGVLVGRAVDSTVRVLLEEGRTKVTALEEGVATGADDDAGGSSVEAGASVVDAGASVEEGTAVEVGATEEMGATDELAVSAVVSDPSLTSRARVASRTASP